MVRTAYKLVLWVVIALAPGGFLLIPLALGRPKAAREATAAEAT